MTGDALVINDWLLRSWLRCPRKAWHDVHGQGAHRLWHPHRSIHLGDEQRRLSCHVARHGLAVARGVEEVFRGAPAIWGLQLLTQGEPQLKGRIPLLLRCDTKSHLGPWSYVPLLVSTGRFMNRGQRLCLAFWGRLLEELQGRLPDHGLLLGPDGCCNQLPLAPLQDQLDRLLEDMAIGLAQPQAPELIAERKHCTICSWRRLCSAHAVATGHLGEVSGIGAHRRHQLIQLQIHTITDLAQSDPLWLGQELARQGHLSQVDYHNTLATDLVLQARSQQTQKPQRRTDPGQDLASQGSLTARLHGAPGVLIYDIEADSDARENYLHGFLSLPRQHHGSPMDLTGSHGHHHPLLCLPHHGDTDSWQRIQSFLSGFPGWPLLHYGETERVELLRLARRVGASSALKKDLKQRFLDVHQLVRQQWVLPLSSYGLKSVATWLGFHWRYPNAEGARSVLWWRHWRRHGHPHDLQRILDYNHDDCRATSIVAAWLLAQESTPWPKLQNVPWDGALVHNRGSSNLVNAADS